MIQLNNIQVPANYTFEEGSELLEFEYKDAAMGLEGMIEIGFDADYVAVDDSFTHEFGVEKESHIEAKKIRIKWVSLTGEINESGVKIEFWQHPIFAEIKEMIEGFGVGRK